MNNSILRAFVSYLFVIALSHAAAQDIPPFNLVWSKGDANDLPSNPQWAFTASHPNGPLPNPLASPCNGFAKLVQAPFSSPALINDVPPSCVSQPVWWMPSGTWCGRHLNWQTAEFEGALFWDINDGHSSPIFNDDDYNFLLGPSNLSTLSTSSPQTIQLEFKAGETIDHFHTPWWSAFHSYVDDNGGTQVNGADAVVIGILGMDCEHSCSTEVHPVLAMAIHDPVRRSMDDDVWAIFVRNWGDEGFCASGWILDQDLTSVTFRIAWRENATKVKVRTDNTQFLWGPDAFAGTPAGNQVSGPNIQISERDAVWVNFTLPAPIETVVTPGVRINGELHLQWTGSGVIDPCASIRARLQTLFDQLGDLTTSVPAIKAANAGVDAEAERRIARWHREHDQEVGQLEQQLASCQNRPVLSSNRVVDVALSDSRTLTPEKRVEAAFRRLPLAQQKAIADELRTADNVSQDAHPLAPNIVSHVSRSLALRQTRLDTALFNPKKADHDRRLKESICRASGNHVPEFACP